MSAHMLSHLAEMQHCLEQASERQLKQTKVGTLPDRGESTDADADVSTESRCWYYNDSHRQGVVSPPFFILVFSTLRALSSILCEGVNKWHHIINKRRARTHSKSEHNLNPYNENIERQKSVSEHDLSQ